MWNQWGSMLMQWSASFWVGSSFVPHAKITFIWPIGDSKLPPSVSVLWLHW